MGSSDNDLVNDGLGDDNNQELIIIPITKRTPSPSTQEGYSTENGVTVINFDKSKHVVCDQCSLSMKCLENHMKAKQSTMPMIPVFTVLSVEYQWLLRSS